MSTFYSLALWDTAGPAEQGEMDVSAEAAAQHTQWGQLAEHVAAPTPTWLPQPFQPRRALQHRRGSRGGWAW